MLSMCIIIYYFFFIISTLKHLEYYLHFFNVFRVVRDKEKFILIYIIFFFGIKTENHLILFLDFTQFFYGRCINFIPFFLS